MAVIAHISDLHVGALAFQPDLLIKVIDEINEMNPDAVIITGDITENGYHMEFEKAAELRPIDLEIGLEAGVIAMLSGHEDAARKSWKSVVDADPASPEGQTAQSYLAQLDKP